MDSRRPLSKGTGRFKGTPTRQERELTYLAGVQRGIGVSRPVQLPRGSLENLEARSGKTQKFKEGAGQRLTTRPPDCRASVRLRRIYTDTACRRSRERGLAQLAPRYTLGGYTRGGWRWSTSSTASATPAAATTAAAEWPQKRNRDVLSSRFLFWHCAAASALL